MEGHSQRAALPKVQNIESKVSRPRNEGTKSKRLFRQPLTVGKYEQVT